MVRHIGRLVAVTVLAATLVACASASSPGETGAPAQAEIISRDMAFSPTTLTVAAGQPFSLRLVNEDAAPHNVAIYSDSSAAEALFVGELITDSSVTYDVPALDPGSYFFRCDLHPEMTGTLVVWD